VAEASSKINAVCISVKPTENWAMPASVWVSSQIDDNEPFSIAQTKLYIAEESFIL
jgi:hypothetical protein